MSLGVPVIANKQCEVLRNHIMDSKGGLVYETYEDFESALFALFDEGFDLATMSRSALCYVSERYQWEPILGKTVNAIAYVSGKEMIVHENQ